MRSNFSCEMCQFEVDTLMFLQVKKKKQNFLLSLKFDENTTIQLKHDILLNIINAWKYYLKISEVAL